MSHTHASTNRLIPKVDDTLVSNLRQPMLTIIEDTAAVHDTVIAACDPQRYRELGVQNWEEHGSCAENLVLALKQINESAGLKGPKAVGADVTVNTAPQPLNLFMNIPFEEGGSLKFEAPKGKKGEYIRLRAERDVVVVFSACPQDILSINGGKPMAAHFVVQEPEKRKPTSARSRTARQPKAALEKAPAQRTAQESEAKTSSRPTSKSASQRRSSTTSTNPSSTKGPSQSSATNTVSNSATPRKRSIQASTATSPTPKKLQPAPKPGKDKPKKLERRTTPKTGIA